MNVSPAVGFLAVALLIFSSGASLIEAQNAAKTAPGKEMALSAKDLDSKVVPDKVFFRGQSAPVQMRNTGGVHFADDFYMLAMLVDNSGYSTGIREKYQAYLITEVPLEIAGQTLKPGAYGCGFLENNKFTVMDLGANDLFQATSIRDAEIKHPVPLQIVAASDAGGKYRFYHGRDYVEFHRTK
ncbi:MAG: hypothetical protein WCE52_00445 [Candidatus Acidiferrum sp.]